MSNSVSAVLWDFGGVLTSSPFEAFNRYEAERGLPKDLVRQINAENPRTNAWAQFESNSIDIDGFDKAFADEAKAKGFEVPGKDIIALLSGHVRPRMVAMLKAIKSQMPVGCITNNVKAGSGPGMAADAERAKAVGEVMALFDVVVESSKEGVRKPEPQIYQIACERMGVAPEKCVFLDDLGINLKPARAMGMQTIKVIDPDVAIDELSRLTGVPAPAL
ncbi:MAG: HAD-IA family hydrolase [Pseudomonadaceae bacterium]|nr:HAD-IA family hydrolase [Pseudomonadaceae bacterium]